MNMSLNSGRDAAALKRKHKKKNLHNLVNPLYNKTANGGEFFVNSVCIDLNVILMAASQMFLFEDKEKQTKT